MLQELMPIYSKDGTCQTIKEYVERHDDTEIDGIKQDIEDLKVDKVDKVENAVEGDVAGLTASGNIFDTGISLYGEKTYDYAEVLNIKNALPVPAVDCKVKVKPIQDLHGYDKPWAPGAGKNLVEETLSGTTITPAGIIQTTAESYDIQIAKVKSGVTYTITSDELFVGGFFTTKPVVESTAYDGSRIADGPKTFTAPIDGYVAFRTSGGYATPQCEVGSIGTSFAPYSNICPISGIDELEIEVSDGESEPTTTTIPLPSTLYGGAVRVDEGSADGTKGKIVLDGSDDEDWRQSTSVLYPDRRVFYPYNLFPNSKPAGNDSNVNLVSMSSNMYDIGTTSYYDIVQMTSFAIGIGGGVDGATIGVNVDGAVIDTIADFKAWLAQNPLEVCYELATPTTLSFDPTDVELLEGTNVVSANTGDISMTVKYDRLADLEDRVTALENA